MPYSLPDTRAIARTWIEELDPTAVVDIGPGAGAYGDLCASIPGVEIDAIEIWEPYVERFTLADKYRKVTIADAFDLQAEAFVGYDLAILGDVIEHVTKDRALNTFQRLSSASVGHAICALPIVHYPQGEHLGNPYEEHVKDDWSHDEFLDAMSPYRVRDFRTFPVVGVYLVEL